MYCENNARMSTLLSKGFFVTQRKLIYTLLSQLSGIQSATILIKVMHLSIRMAKEKSLVPTLLICTLVQVIK